MKITKISLQNFRAFDECFELDLADGKNLLLHGENGSGKSSLFFALKRFFEERGDAIANHHNYFAPSSRNAYVQLHVKGSDAAGNSHDRDFIWNDADGHPLTIPSVQATASISPELRSMLVDGAHRAGFLDYRGMLRTNMLSTSLSRSNRGPRIHDAIYGAETKGLEAQLFDLVTLSVLAGVRVSTSGGGESTIGDLMRKVWENRPLSRRRWDLGSANRAANDFNSAINAVLPELEAKLVLFLNHFDNHCLTIKFGPVSLAWEKASLELKGANLVPEITFRGKAISDHHLFLNEARLSALGLCLFLAGVLLSDNDYANPGHPRILVLDDALIGLELQNRLPLLGILAGQEFRNYQIFLFTYDRVWFDLAREHLPEKDNWLHRELLADEVTGRLVPKLRASETDLDRAKSHLANGDLKAAAVYARSALEWRLRNVSEKNGIRVPFKSDADKVGAGVLWDAIILRQREREDQRQKGSVVLDFVTADLEKEVSIIRSTVLNKLSHSAASGLVQAEVAAAIQVVEALLTHPFPKGTSN